MKKTLSEFCIYTIKRPDEVAESVAKGRSVTYRERKPWVTGEKLWLEAEAAKLQMPVLIGDATDCSQLQYWGLLKNVRLENDTETLYTVENLKRLRRKHSPQELVLRSEGRKIKPRFIRSYAICITPNFLN